MTAPLDLRNFDRDLQALNSRVDQLRRSRLAFGDDERGSLDAALLELETAEEELRACREEIESAAEQLAQPSRRQERERQLMRQVFRHAPFGLFVLDRDAAIRQANPRAAGMVGTPLEFLSGKPMPVFLDMADRAAFRTHLAAVLRAGLDSLVSCRLTGRGHQAEVQLALSRLTGEGSVRPLALAAVWAGGGAPEPASAVYPRASQVAAMVDGSLRLDIMSRMTRLLLGGTPVTRLLPAAAQLLVEECADWAVIDLVASGTPVRQAVAGPRGPVTGAEPDAPVIEDVLAGGSPAVLDPIQDENAFGHSPSGAPVLAAVRAGSLVSVALPAAGRVAGALTVIRRADRRGFSLADVSLLEEIGVHLALALGNRGLLDGGSAAPAQ